MFQLVLLSLLFWLAIFSTVLRPVQAVNLADIESQMVDGDGIPLRGSNGGLAAKKPFMLYPQLLDDLLDGKSTTPSSPLKHTQRAAMTTRKPNNDKFWDNPGAMLAKEVIKGLIRQMIASAFDSKMKDYSNKKGNQYSNNNYKSIQQTNQPAAHQTMPSKTPAPYGWNI